MQCIFPGKASTMPKHKVNIGKKTGDARRSKRWYGKNSAMKIAKVQEQRAGMCYYPNRYDFPIPLFCTAKQTRRTLRPRGTKAVATFIGL